MTTNIQLLRSSVAQKRPQPSSLLEGQPAVNLNVSEPGLFFKASDGSLFKVGPVAVNTTGNAPNSAAVGPVGNVPGETWLDGRASYSNPVLKIFNGSSWVTGSGFLVDNASGNFSLAKTLTVSTLIANGTGANAYIRLPNAPNATEPSLPTAAGSIYFNTTTNSFRGYDGTTWSDLGSGTVSNQLVLGNSQINGNLTVDGNVTLGTDCLTTTLVVNSATTINCNAQIGASGSNTLTIPATTTFSAATGHANRNPVRFYSGNVGSSNYVALRAPSSIVSNVTWTLPAADGGAGQILQTDGAGNLSWSTGTGNTAGGSNTQVQFNSGGLLAGTSNLTFDGTTLTAAGLNITGNTTIGNDTFDTVSVTARVTTSILPSVDNAVNLGGVSNRWANLFVANLNLGGNFLPDADNVRNLGSPGFRWANIYTGDLHLANERGDWTMVEESEYLTLRNNKTGKTFKLMMEEV